MKYFVEQRACANKYNPKEEERGAIKDVGTSKFWGSGKVIEYRFASIGKEGLLEVIVIL